AYVVCSAATCRLLSIRLLVGVRGTRCPVFPYTTLFRSRRLSEDSDLARRLPRVVHGDPVHDAPPQELGGRGADAGPTDEADMDAQLISARGGEHGPGPRGQTAGNDERTQAAGVEIPGEVRRRDLDGDVDEGIRPPRLGVQGGPDAR